MLTLRRLPSPSQSGMLLARFPTCAMETLPFRPCADPVGLLTIAREHRTLLAHALASYGLPLGLARGLAHGSAPSGGSGRSDRSRSNASAISTPIMDPYQVSSVLATRRERRWGNGRISLP